jgi:hypothetical protein
MISGARTSTSARFKKTQKLTFVALLFFAIGSVQAVWSQAPPATNYTFTTFNPGGCTDCGIYASARGIDNAGDVVGAYLVSKVFNGYERAADGTFSSYYDSSGIATLGVGINSGGTIIVGEVCAKVSGDIVRPPIRTGGGGCNDGYGFVGFIYQNGSFTQYEFQNLPSTYINAVNDKGVFVGNYYDPTTKLFIGFISNGKTISYNGGGTSLNSINDNGIIVGSAGSVGIQTTLSGMVTKTFQYPDAASTAVNGINLSKEVVGMFTDSSGLAHGFTYKGGKYTELPNPPGAASEVVYFGINDSGQLSGSYLDSTNNLWGFIATPQ